MAKKEADDANFYLGNKKLPKANVEFEWTPQMVKELQKCKRNLIHFAENHFHVINIDKGKIKIPLYPCQKRVLRTLRDHRFVINLASRQVGKALALDTPILTTDGWKTMETIQDGDKVFGSDGKPINVVKAHDILYDRECYEIEFDNGEKIIADGDHRWWTQSLSERTRVKPVDGSIKLTKDLANDVLTKRNEPKHRIKRSVTGIHYPHKDLPITPYVLGLWLGDGSCDSARITVGERDIDDCLEILKEHQTQFDKFSVKNYKGTTHSLTVSVNENIKTKSLNTLLKKYNLKNNKHIPDEYMTSSREQRLELLRGLMDSDGYMDNKGCAFFYNTNLPLCEQVFSLVQSLGYKPTYNKKIPKLNGIEQNECGIVTFAPCEYVFHLPFKKERINPRELVAVSHKRQDYYYIKSIKKVDSIPVRCITVDAADEIFLCGKGLIPTMNTTMMTIYTLWNICFNDDQNVLIAANKEKTAIQIFQRIRLAYEELPNYLKPGVVEWGKTYMKLDNGSAVDVTTTSSDAGRGSSCSLLLLDELAFVPDHMTEKFWKSVYPIISSSKKAKIFIASTPNGIDNLFFRLCQEAEQGKSNWKIEKIYWHEIPGRDEKWKKDTIANLGNTEAFDQEYDLKFLESGESFIEESVLVNLKSGIQNPKHIFDNGAYKIWEEPEIDHLYSIGVDVAEGVGRNFSVLNVFDITDLTDIRQVACFSSNTINPYEFTPKINEIAYHWGAPPISIERNNCGQHVVDTLYTEFKYPNMVSYGSRSGQYKYERVGIFAHTNTKYHGVMNMQYWVSKMKCVTIRDADLVDQIKFFVRHPNGTWSAKTGHHDDHVMALIWSLVILDNDIIGKFYNILEFDDNRRPLKIKLSEFVQTYFRGFVSEFKALQVPDAWTPPGFSYETSGFENESTEIDDLRDQGYEFLY